MDLLELSFYYSELPFFWTATLGPTESLLCHHAHPYHGFCRAGDLQCRFPRPPQLSECSPLRLSARRRSAKAGLGTDGLLRTSSCEPQL